MIKSIEELLLPITDFRKNMTRILATLDKPKILMNRDKAQAVIVPYDIFIKMEQALEEKYDEILINIASDRVAESAAQYQTHDQFWAELDD